MSIYIKPAVLSGEQNKLLQETISFSVDCDSISHYLNFAPIGTDVSHDVFTYQVMTRGLLRIFRRHNIRATFFCIADQLDNPDTLAVFKEIVASGHEIGNHTFSHADIAFLTEEEHLRDIRLSHEKISILLKVEPVGYRAPAYFITEGGLSEIAKMGYLYDSSLCSSTAWRLMTHALKMLNPHFRPKKIPSLHLRFKGKSPYLIEFSDRNKILEWPIPKMVGLPYYGTIHCCLPSFVFSLQTSMLNILRRYIHYEIHPIEVVTTECLREFPWLNKIPFTNRGDLFNWLEYRVGRLISKRRTVTLKELSNAYLHS